MGLFSRNRRGDQLVPQQVLSLLADFGEVAVAARAAGSGAVTDPRFTWSDFFAPVRTAFQTDPERVVTEVCAATEGVPRADLAACGGYLLLVECDPQLEDARFVALQDAFLDHVRSLKFGSAQLNRYEADRWIATHGDLHSSFDGIYAVEVPAPGAGPECKPLEPGESRLIARVGPGETDNRFFAERQADGRYLVYSERLWEPDSPRMDRCEEPTLGSFDSLPDLLRAVGNMFGTPPYWADDDLMPYFPAHRD